MLSGGRQNLRGFMVEGHVGVFKLASEIELAVNFEAVGFVECLYSKFSAPVCRRRMANMLLGNALVPSCPGDKMVE